MTLDETFARLRPGRSIEGIAAALLPYTCDGTIDWAGFERILTAIDSAGLAPAVNMDTGFGDLLAPDERESVLAAARRFLGASRPIYAGAYPDPDAVDLLPGYRRSIATITEYGCIPVIVQSRRMHDMPAVEKAALYTRMVDGVERAIGFELGSMFAPHGEIWDEETFARIIAIPELHGAKHSSLDRATEFRRLALRDRERPSFHVYTGNDLAIDMVAYGSDYLLGLATFAPHAFARRDAAFAANDPTFLSSNDGLQHLGNVGFRAPVPAYKHAAAQFLHIAGVLDGDAIHPAAARRPASDRILLFDCAKRIGVLDDPESAYAERIAPYVA